MDYHPITECSFAILVMLIVDLILMYVLGGYTCDETDPYLPETCYGHYFMDTIMQTLEHCHKNNTFHFLRFFVCLFPLRFVCLFGFE